MTTRRAFLIVAAAWPVLGRIDLSRARPAKPPGKVVRLGILRVGPAPAVPGAAQNVFVETLRELGWIEGRNIVYDVAYAEDEGGLAEAAAALVARRPDVIYTPNGPTARAAAKATRTIPIVFSSVPDPIEGGLVKTLSQPGGNVTGVATFGGELGARRMQLLKEVLPKITCVGVLVSASTAATNEQKVIEQAAGSGVKVIPAVVKAATDLDSAFAFLAKNKCEAVLITQAALLNAQRKTILQLAAKYRMPAVGFRSEQVEVGALMSYNSSLTDHTRRAAQLVDRVLKGKKPAEIPVEQPTTFELAVNLKTAKALGITIPQTVLLQASRVIE